MSSSIKKVIAGLLLIPVMMFGLTVMTPMVAMAADCDMSIEGGAACPGQTGDLMTFVKNLTNTALFVVGSISVIMIIYGGIKYVISGGVAANVTAAKNTILYAVIGIVVSLLAYAIVNFVISTFIQ